MGTTPNKKVSHDITINARNVDPVTGKGVVAGSEKPVEVKQPERSFAQPSPVVPQKTVTPKTHASATDEQNALKKNSTLKPE